MNILVINPSSAAVYVIKRFQEMGESLIAVGTDTAKTDMEQRLHPFRDYMRLPVNDFIDVSELSVDQRIQCIDEAYEKYYFKHGFSGSESGLQAAEIILAHLFPSYRNDPQTSQYRFDKYWMNEILREQGVPSISQLSIEANMSFDEKVNITKKFYEMHNKDIILKPRTGSAASVDVFKPKTLGDIEDYFNSEHHGFFYQSDFLVQEVVYGDEYYIDYASYDDEHRLVAIGNIEKELVNGSFEYLYADNLSLENDIAMRLSDYVLKCIKILGVKNGFSHVEVKNTPQGLRLIELNPRLSGSDGYHNVMAKRRYNKDQIDVYLDLIRGDESQRSIPKKPLYQRLVYFKNKMGTYNFVDTTPVKSLRSYITHELKVPKMLDDHNAGISMMDIVMYVLLESDQKDVVEEDFNLLMSYQKTADCLKLVK